MQAAAYLSYRSRFPALRPRTRNPSRLVSLVMNKHIESVQCASLFYIPAHLVIFFLPSANRVSFRKERGEIRLMYPAGFDLHRRGRGFGVVSD